MMTLAYYYFVRVREWFWSKLLGWYIRRVNRQLKMRNDLIAWVDGVKRRRKIREEIMR